MWPSQFLARSADARASDPVLIPRLAPLVCASFRRRLAGTPLRFATLRLHQDGRGLSPPTRRTCSAHKEKPPPSRAGVSQFSPDLLLLVVLLGGSGGLGVLRGGGTLGGGAPSGAPCARGRGGTAGAGPAPR